MNEVQFWVITSNADKIEGRGSSVDCLFFTNEAEAKKAAHDPIISGHYGVMGAPLSVELRTIQVHDSAEEASAILKAHIAAQQVLDRAQRAADEEKRRAEKAQRKADKRKGR